MRSHDDDVIDSEVESIEISTSTKKLPTKKIQIPQVLTLKRSFQSMPDLPNTRIMTFDTKSVTKDDLHNSRRVPSYEAWGEKRDKIDLELPLRANMSSLVKAKDCAGGLHDRLSTLHDINTSLIAESQNRFQSDLISPLYREIKVEPRDV